LSAVPGDRFAARSAQGARDRGEVMDIRLEIEREFVGMLMRCPRMGEESSRQLLVANIGRRVGAELSLRGQATTRTYVVELVHVCARLPHGLDLLVDELEFLDPLAPEIPELLHLCDEWQAAGIYADDMWPELRSALRSIVLPPGDAGLDELRRLVATATGAHIKELPKHCSTLWHAFTYLAGVDSLPNALPPCMVLLDCVASGISDPVLAAKLRSWNRAWSERRQITDDPFAERPPRISPNAPPAPLASTSRIRPETFFPLVDALEAVPSLLSEDGRVTLISLLPPGIGGAVRYSAQRRIHAINIVRACLEYEGGLAELIAGIRYIEGEKSIPLRRLITAARDLPPELRPDQC
jgi:hypothetical protein